MSTKGLIASLAFLLLTGCIHQKSTPPAQPSASNGSGVPVRTDPYTLQQDIAPEKPQLTQAQLKDAIPKEEPLSAYGNHSPYEILGKTYEVLPSAKGYSETGVASWYGVKFHGHHTSSWEPYDMFAMSAAHKSLPLPSYARITNLENGKTAVVRVNDRGPFHDDRIIDLSYAAATKLGYVDRGTANVKVEAIHTDSTPNEQIKTPATITPSQSMPLFYIQLGAYQKITTAEQRLSKLIGLPWSAWIKIDEQQPQLYKIQMGPFASRKHAEKAAEEWHQQRGEKPLLVSY